MLISILYNYTMKPESIIPQFDEYLFKDELSFEAIVVGGAALAIMGIIQRETQDCDILDPMIPDSIKNAAVEFAESIRQQEVFLKENWLNNGPVSLTNDLPKGWQSRIVKIYQGKALTLYALGRDDFLKAKIFSFCDREQDRDDCIQLNPSRQELLELKGWLIERDGNTAWAKHVEASLKSLAMDLGYDL